MTHFTYITYYLLFHHLLPLKNYENYYNSSTPHLGSNPNYLIHQITINNHPILFSLSRPITSTHSRCKFPPQLHNVYKAIPRRSTAFVETETAVLVRRYQGTIQKRLQEVWIDERAITLANVVVGIPGAPRRERREEIFSRKRRSCAHGQKPSVYILRLCS